MHHLRFGLKSTVLLAVLVTTSTSVSALPQPQSAMNNSSSAVEQWQKLQDRGANAFFNSQYGIAERVLKQAVLRARSLKPPEVRYAKSAGDLGRLLTVRGRFKEAEPYLEEELRIKKAAVGEDDSQLIPNIGSLIEFYLEYGTTTKALPLTETLLEFVNGRIEEAHSQASGKITLKKGVPLQGWAGQAAPVMHDPLVEWAITFDAIGDAYRLQNNTEMAERLYKTAMDMKMTVLGKDHLSLANSYDRLGTIALARNNNEEAESYFRDSLATTERIQPPEHPQVYSRLDKLARCLIKEGKLDEAEQLYSRATKLWSTNNPSNCGNEARALFALGCLYSDEKKYAEAQPVLQQALDMAQQYHGTDSAQIVPYLRKLAYVEYYLGNKPENESLKARADEIEPIQEALKATAGSIESPQSQIK